MKCKDYPIELYGHELYVERTFSGHPAFYVCTEIDITPRTWKSHAFRDGVIELPPFGPRFMHYTGEDHTFPLECYSDSIKSGDVLILTSDLNPLNEGRPVGLECIGTSNKYHHWTDPLFKRIDGQPFIFPDGTRGIAGFVTLFDLAKHLKVNHGIIFATFKDT